MEAVHGNYIENHGIVFLNFYGLWSVTYLIYHFWVTVTLTSDILSRILVS